MTYYDIYSNTYGDDITLFNGFETVTVRLSTDYAGAAKTSDGERWFENRGDGVWFEYGDYPETSWVEVL